MNAWNHILTADELKALHALTAKLDPSFASKETAWYASRTEAQLRGVMAGAWNANDSTSYQMARSYLNLLTA